MSDPGKSIPQIVVTKRPPEAELPDRTGWGNSPDAFVRGVADVFSLGLADELAAAGDATFNPIFGTGLPGATFGERYDKSLQRERAIDKIDHEQQFGPRLAGQLAGGVALPSAGAKTATGRVAIAAGTGGGYGFGSGEGAQDRLIGAGTGMLAGGAVAGATPYAVPYIKNSLDWLGQTRFGKPALDTAEDFVGYLYSRVRPDDEGLRLAGKAYREAREAGFAVPKLDRNTALANGQPITLLDIAKTYGQGLAGWANRTSPQAGQALENFTKQRFEAQNTRAANFLNNLTGAKSGYDDAITVLRVEAGRRPSGATSLFGTNDAYQAGRKLASESIDGAETAFSRMNAAEKELFRHGYASELIHRVRNVPKRGNILKDVFPESLAWQSQIPQVLGPEKARQLEIFLHIEKLIELQMKANAVFGHPGAEMASVVGQGVMDGALLKKVLAQALRVGNQEIDEKVALRVSHVLTSTNPHVWGRALAAASRNRTIMNAIRDAETKLSGLMGVAASSAFGRPASHAIQQRAGINGREPNRAAKPLDVPFYE